MDCERVVMTVSDCDQLTSRTSKSFESVPPIQYAHEGYFIFLFGDCVVLAIDELCRLWILGHNAARLRPS